MRKIYSLLLLGGLLLLGAQDAWGRWVGASAINVNGTWYKGTAHEHNSWAGSSFDGADLGYIHVLALGGISEVYTWDGDDWPVGSEMTMYYKIDAGGTPQSIILKKIGKNGNNQKCQSGGSTFATTDIDLSDYDDGNSHTLHIWFYSDDGNGGDEAWDSNNNQNYKATFTVGVTIGSSTWATFSSTKEFQIPSGLTAYRASSVSSSAVTLSPITGGYIPANTGVVLHGTAGNYAGLITTTSASLAGDNYLEANTVPTNLPTSVTESLTTYYHYTLAYESSAPVFKHSSGDSKTLAAGKAYLKTTENVTGDGAPAIIRGENDATNIDAVDAVEEGVKFVQNGKLFIKKNGVVYDMMGAIVK